MHDVSRYCIALDAIRAKDWPKLPQLFEQRLKDVLLAEQINLDKALGMLAATGNCHIKIAFD